MCLFFYVIPGGRVEKERRMEGRYVRWSCSDLRWQMLKRYFFWRCWKEKLSYLCVKCIWLLWDTVDKTLFPLTRNKIHWKVRWENRNKKTQYTRVVLSGACVCVVFQDFLVTKHINTFVFDYVKKKTLGHLFLVSWYLFSVSPLGFCCCCCCCFILLLYVLQKSRCALVYHVTLLEGVSFSILAKFWIKLVNNYISLFNPFLIIALVLVSTALLVYCCCCVVSTHLICIWKVVSSREQCVYVPLILRPN